MAAPYNASPAPIEAQNSPRSRQSRRPQGVSPPSDTSVIDQEQILTYSSSTNASSGSKEASIPAAADDGSLGENSENVGASKKPAWNKPSGAAVPEVGAMMEAESWPALSDLARGSPKSSSTNSPRAIVHGLPNVSQGVAVGHKEFTTNVSAPNNVGPTRQRSMKRGGNSSHIGMPSNGSLFQEPPLQSAVVEAPPSNPGKSGASAGESSRDNTHRDTGQRGGSYGGNEQQRGSFRRSNSGPLLHQNHGNRREQERGKKEWNVPSRSFGSRESHTPQQRVGSRPFMRGPSPNSHFISPQPPSVGVRPFVTPMIYSEVPSPVYYMHGPHPDSLGHVPMLPLSPMFFPMPDPALPSKIVYQIDYYFSSENLVKDTFLRQNMDNEGWVPITLIAGFKKVKLLTDNIQLILDAVQASSVVEVQGDKVRRKHDWIKWIMPTAQYSTVTSPQPLHKSSPDTLAGHLSSVTLEEKTAT